MRKMFFTIVLLICSAFTLCAGDADDVKDTILQSVKNAAEQKWDQAFPYYAEDCKLVDDDGNIASLNQLKEMILMFDGAHPYEFLIFAYKMENNGKEPSSAEKNQFKKTSQDPEYQVKYTETCKLFMGALKEDSRLQLETIKFRNVEVNGAVATVTYDTDSIDYESNNIVPKVTVCKLRKINGFWKICEEVTKKK